MRKGSKTIAKSSTSTFIYPSTIEKRIFKVVTQELRYQYINASTMVVSYISRKMLCVAILDEADRMLKIIDGFIFASSVRQATFVASSHCQYL